MSAGIQFTHPTPTTVPLMRPIAPSPAARVLEVALLLGEARRHLDLISDEMDDEATSFPRYVELLYSEDALYRRIEILERRHYIALADFDIECEAIARPFKTNPTQIESGAGLDKGDSRACRAGRPRYRGGPA